MSIYIDYTFYNVVISRGSKQWHFLLDSLIKSQGVKLQKQQTADFVLRIPISRFTFLKQAAKEGSLHITT